MIINGSMVFIFGFVLFSIGLMRFLVSIMPKIMRGLVPLRDLFLCHFELMSGELIILMGLYWPK